MRKIITIISGLLVGFAAYAQPIVTDSTSNSTVNSNSTATTTVKSPPPSAISPSIGANNSDLCTVGVSGAVQTQILGISGGTTVRDMNWQQFPQCVKMNVCLEQCGKQELPAHTKAKLVQKPKSFGFRIKIRCL